MELATSGISGLDAQLGGGLPRGTTVLVIGDPCNALSTFAEQFSAGGLVHSEQVLYFQFDRPARGAPGRITNLAKELGGARGKLGAYDGYSGQFGQSLKDAMADVTLLSAETTVGGNTIFGKVLNEVLRVGGVKYRIAIDSLSSMASQGQEPQLLDFFRNLVHLGHETGGMHMVTLVKGLLDPATEARLKHYATGIIEIGIERKGFGLYNTLQVTKLMDLKDPTRLVLFKETEKGLWLESTKRVF